MCYSVSETGVLFSIFTGFCIAAATYGRKIQYIDYRIEMSRSKREDGKCVNANWPPYYEAKHFKLTLHIDSR